MTSLTIQPQWHDTINQIEKNEYMLGGATGNMNIAPKQLAENIFWLKANMQTESYKVGDIYTTTIHHADSNAVKNHHGYGEWQRFAEGRTPVGFSDNAEDIAEYKTMGNMFGKNTHQLKIDEMPNHSHPINFQTNNISGGGHPATENGSSSPANLTTEAIGGNQPHNNIQPSIVVAYWLRTA